MTYLKAYSYFTSLKIVKTMLRDIHRDLLSIRVRIILVGHIEIHVGKQDTTEIVDLQYLDIPTSYALDAHCV